MIDKVLPVVLRALAAVAKDPLQRNKLYIQTLKRFKWEPDHPPAEFKAVYAYTLVDYALADETEKLQELLELFAEPEIQTAFRQAFDQWDVAPLSEAIDKRLEWQDFGNEWNFVGNAIRQHNVDIQREVAVFFGVFLRVVRRSQTPKEQLQAFLLERFQQNLSDLRLQLVEVFKDVDRLTDEVADKVADKITGKLQEALPGLTGQ